MSSIILITKKDLKQYLPVRPKTTNKSHGGKSLVIAGSHGLWGACYLCAYATARVGAGYVYLPENTKNLSKHPDFLSTPMTATMNFEKFSAIAIGSGLSATSLHKRIFKTLEKKFNGPVVIDAGALELVQKLKDNWIITPHEGELARLLNTTSDNIRKNRLKAVRSAQKKFGGLVVLKGHHTLIATDSAIYQVQTGNKALAKAGTGDVLTGMILGFLSQGLEPYKAAILAVGIHGLIADTWVKDKDYLSLIASDIINDIPKTLFKLRK